MTSVIKVTPYVEPVIDLLTKTWQILSNLNTIGIDITGLGSNDFDGVWPSTRGMQRNVWPIVSRNYTKQL